MPSQILTATGSSTQSGVINSTKARVVSTAAIYLAVGQNPTAGTGFANTIMIPSNTVRYVNMTGLGNKVAILQVAGGGANVEVTDIGVVSSTSIMGSTVYKTT
jgi:hypothetical protein